ncbi:MAG TPA: diaminopimelate epimerase [Pirellulaceae bacterium]
MRFVKYHALGNDYLVWEGGPANFPCDVQSIRLFCDRHRGAGADGLLVGDWDGQVGQVRIFNPDGSEAEISGNGVRIFARYLADSGKAAAPGFAVRTPGGDVWCDLLPDHGIRAALGPAQFNSVNIPLTGPPREVLDEPITLEDRTLRISAVGLGNPHCVVMVPRVDRDLALQLGPVLEWHPLFPQRTNVQFVEVVDRHTLRIEIWERGAGYTWSSGTSASAAAAVAVRLGVAASPIRVRSPGGECQIEIDRGFEVSLAGPVTRVAEITMEKNWLADATSHPHTDDHP